MKNIAIGIDIGGTFTDIVALDYGSGSIQARKVLTTHGDPTLGVINGLQLLFQETGIVAGDVMRVVHATTLFTNALIENKGVLTGLLTTHGFRDVIEIGRERRYDLYDVNIEAAPPLVPRHLRAEITGRLDAGGQEVEPPNRADVRQAVQALLGHGVQSLAICLLHAYADDRHERLVSGWISEDFPELSVSLSCEISPEIREFDRLCTTTANACIQPIARHYLDTLETRLGSLGLDCGVLMMLSNGGLCDIAVAKRKPIELLESGPAAGAISAAWSGQRDGYRNLLAFDMGGTTAKLSLVESGRPAVAHGFEAARRKRFAEGSGIPIKITTVDLIEIGAGGGSIARGDDMQLLKVGPDSAGSEPGPACYGLGGTDATVTDANLVLGYLNPDYFAGGSINIETARAMEALEKLGRTLKLPTLDVARGIHDIVAENMAGAARVHVAERGHDPRDFVMVCTGGGGPLHAYSVARKIGVRTIVCPAAAGVASAVGLLVSPARADRSRTVGFRPDVDALEVLENTFAALEADGFTSLEPLTAAFGPALATRHADGRFVGQGFTLTVELPPGPYAGADVNADEMKQALVQAFEQSYREKFGRTPPDVPVELVSLRATVSAMPRQPFQPQSLPALGEARETSRRDVYFAEAAGYLSTPVYARRNLPAGAVLAGPLLIEDEGSTLVVGPSGRVEQQASGNLVITLLEIAQ